MSTTDILTSFSRELLEKGKGVRLQVTGLSMFPTIRPGDFVHIEPKKDLPPELGQILFFKDGGGRLVLHRLAAVEKKGQETWLLMKGDGYTRRLDRIVSDAVLGIASWVEKGGIKRKLRSDKPGIISKTHSFVHYFLVKLWSLLKSKV